MQCLVIHDGFDRPRLNTIRVWLQWQPGTKRPGNPPNEAAWCAARHHGRVRHNVGFFDARNRVSQRTTQPPQQQSSVMAGWLWGGPSLYSHVGLSAAHRTYVEVDFRALSMGDSIPRSDRLPRANIASSAATDTKIYWRARGSIRRLISPRGRSTTFDLRRGHCSRSGGCSCPVGRRARRIRPRGYQELGRGRRSGQARLEAAPSFWTFGIEYAAVFLESQRWRFSTRVRDVSFRLSAAGNGR